MLTMMTRLARPVLSLLLLATWGCGQDPQRSRAATFDPHPASEPRPVPLDRSPRVADSGPDTVAKSDPAPATQRPSAGGVVFTSMGLDEALARGRAEKKLVMVDLYADWCGWCKKLDSDVFTDAQVAASLADVVSVKIDADREGAPLMDRFRVDGLPAVLFFNGGGELLERIDGYVTPDEFLRVAAALPRKKA